MIFGLQAEAEVPEASDVGPVSAKSDRSAAHPGRQNCSTQFVEQHLCLLQIGRIERQLDYCGREADALCLGIQALEPGGGAMTIKSILVPLVGNTIDEVALSSAVVVAKRFDAHVEGMHIRISADEASNFVSSRLDTALYAQVLEKLQVQIAQEEKEARRRFEELIELKGLGISSEPSKATGPSASWRSMTGDPADIIARSGGAFDLIVASHPMSGREALPRQVLDTAIFNTARPVLLASKEAPSHFGETVLLAWNRGIQAGRALISAMPFLQTASKIVVLMVTTGAKQGPEPEEIAANLAWHDVDAEVKRLPPDDRSVGEALLDEAAEMGADLLVMGAYSQSRLRDRVPGGVTKAVLTRADVPVLMAR